MQALRQNPQLLTRRFLELLYGDDGMCIAAWGPLLVGVWWREPAQRDLEAFRSAQYALVEEHGMVSTLSVLRHPLSLSVDEGLREAETHRIRDLGACTLASAFVVEERGLRANFFRSVVTGMYLNARTPTQYLVSDTVGEAVQWLVGSPGTEIRLRSEVDALVSSVEQLADRRG